MAILATCVRNEGIYLLEWIAYYSLLGFSRIIIYSNDNTDESDQLLSLLSSYGYIDWRPRKLKANESPQATAFEQLSDELLRHETPSWLAEIPEQARYLAWFDCDEYLHIKSSQVKTILDLLQMYSLPDGLAVNWRHFGSSGERYYDSRPTIQRFTQCSLPGFHLNKMIKTICKLDNNMFPGVISQHRPITRHPKSIITYAAPRGQHEAVPAAILDGGAFASNVKGAKYWHVVCQLNHYAVRSEQEYLLKQSRGNGWNPLGLANQNSYPDHYFQLRDRNDISETSLCDHVLDQISCFISGLESPILNAHDKVKSVTLEHMSTILTHGSKKRNSIISV